MATGSGKNLDENDTDPLNGVDIGAVINYLLFDRDHEIGRATKRHHPPAF